MVNDSKESSPAARNGYLPGLAAGVWSAALDQARATQRQVWRRWALCLLVGYLVSGAVAVGAVYLVRAWVEHGLQAWDQRWIETVAASAFTFPAGLWFEAWGSSAFLIPLLLVAVVLLVRGGYLFRAATLVVGYLSTKGLVLGAWQLWDRARPESVAGGIAAPGLHSFPSGHAVNAVVMFGLIGVFWWRASHSVVERATIVPSVGLVVLLTCLGRVRLGTHWPSDIIAGLVIGLVWLVALGLAVVLAERAGRMRVA